MDAADDSGAQPWSVKHRRQKDSTSPCTRRLKDSKTSLGCLKDFTTHESGTQSPGTFDLFEDTTAGVKEPKDLEFEIATLPPTVQVHDIAADDDSPAAAPLDSTTSQLSAKQFQDDLSAPCLQRRPWAEVEDDDDPSGYRFFDELVDDATADAESRVLQTQCGPIAFLQHARETLPDVFACSSVGASEASSVDGDPDTDPFDNVVPFVSCPELLHQAPVKGFEKECSTRDVSTSPSSGTQQTPCTTADQPGRLKGPSRTQYTPCTSLGGATTSVISPTNPITSHPVESAPESRRSALSSWDEGVQHTLGRLKDFTSLGSHPGSCTQQTPCSDTLGRIKDYTSLGSHLGSSTQQTPCTADDLLGLSNDATHGRLKDFTSLGSHPSSQNPNSWQISVPAYASPRTEPKFSRNFGSSHCTQQTPCTDTLGRMMDSTSLGSHLGSSTQQTPCTADDLPGLSNAATHVPGEALDFDGFTIFDLDGEGRLKDFDSQGHGIGTQCGPLPQHQLESTQFGPLPQSQSSGFPTSRTQCGHLPQQHSPRTSTALDEDGHLRTQDALCTAPLLVDTLAGMKDTLAQLVTTASVRTSSFDDRLALLDTYAAATRQFELWEQAQYTPLAPPPVLGRRNEQAQQAPLVLEPSA